jgi:hypothetical protein
MESELKSPCVWRGGMKLTPFGGQKSLQQMIFLDFGGSLRIE